MKLFILSEGRGGDSQDVFIATSEESLIKFINKLYDDLVIIDDDSYYKRSYNCNGDALFNNTEQDRIMFCDYLMRYHLYYSNTDEILINII